MSIKNIIPRVRIFFLKDRRLYIALYNIIGFYPRDINYYKQALQHKSAQNRKSRKGQKALNNERLEFLGDAILDAIVGDIVYRHFPKKREGFLTNTRSKLVQRETLGRLSKAIGLVDLVKASTAPSSHNSYVGGNAFEAIVGAIYLDRGYDACMRFMKKRILKEMINLDKMAYKEVNFKSRLIEWSQKNKINTTFSLVLEKKAEGGSPKFIYKVMLEDVEGGTGEGYSKKESQQQASRLTLERLRKDSLFIDKVFAAKTNRTKMEEEPIALPDTSVPDFLNIEEANEDKHLNAFSERVYSKEESAKDARHADSKENDK